nr:MAG TPA: ChiA1-BD-binding domain protein [Caudoviricetes sp.]
MTRILDKSGNELKQEDIDLNAGKLVDETITVHHDAVEGVEEVSHVEVLKEYYQTGPDGEPVLDEDGHKIVFGKDVQTVIDVPGVEAKAAYDEQEEIQRYIPYTAEELDKIAKEKADAQASAAVAAAEKSAIRIIVKNIAPALTTDELLQVAAILPDWDASKTYSEDDVVRYQQSLYQAIGEVPADTVPNTSTDKWKDLTKPVDGVARWVQPNSAENAYDAEAVVMHDDQQWTSNDDYNMHEPGVDGWTLKGEAIAEWAQPTDANDAYAEGAVVRHNGKRWVSTVSGNVWEPGASGVTQWIESR